MNRKQKKLERLEHKQKLAYKYLKDRSDKDKVFYEEFKNICSESHILQSEQFIQHGNVSVLQHSIAVAYYSLRLARKFKWKVNERELIRGALLHDYFLYDWHTKNAGHEFHGFSHPYKAYKNACTVLNLTRIERDIIIKHMFPLTPFPPKYRESLLVCMVDKACSISETFYIDNFSGLYRLSKEQQ